MHLLCSRLKYRLFFLIAALTALLHGCITPKKYQPGKPFVFSTNINIEGNLRSDERADLKLRLENQLDDSLKVKRVADFPGHTKLVKPPVFDTGSASRSAGFMNNLLQSLGYYKASITWDSTMTIVKDQQRVTVDFFVKPGKSYKFDTISYRLQDSTLQALALSRRNATLLKKGQPYSVELVAAELDRLVDLFRNNGYYKFSREDLTAERDTIFAALINPSLDPFEQLRLLDEAKKRQENLTMNLVIQLRNPELTSHFRKYYLRNVTIYPDLDLLEDTLAAHYDTSVVQGIRVLSKFDKFKPEFIVSKSALRPGEPFRQRNSTRTFTNFIQLNTFLQVNVDMSEVKDSSNMLDAVVRMYPLKKQDMSISADASYNTQDVVASGNLFGVGLNLGFANRNVKKQAIQTSTNLRTGVEIDAHGTFIQTQQVSLSHSIAYPKLIVPQFLLKKINTDSLRTQRTLVNMSASYTDRKDFYQLKSVYGSLGYTWSRSRRNRMSHTWYFSPLNVEFVQFNPRDQFNTLLESNPNLKYAYNSGMVLSMIGVYNYVKSSANGTKTNDLRLSVEESGGLAGFIKTLDEDASLYRFIKFDADYRHYFSFRKTALVVRAYGGIGIPYGKEKDGSYERQLPFFKAFYAGGPYSMRAWQLRQMGIGSSRYFDTSTAAKGVDRYGDIQLEGNIEYRFNLGTLFGVLKLKSALFADFGNIWYRTNYGDPNYDGAEFNLARLGKDLGLGAGTSLRADFDYFLIRFDWAYKLKDPAHAYENNGWFYDVQLLKGQFQLGINYPF